MAEELKDRGNEEFKKGNLEEAASLYTEAISASLTDKAMLGTILTNRFVHLTAYVLQLSDRR
jgi:hypothetical protein